MRGLEKVWNDQSVPADGLLSEDKDEGRDIIREVRSMSKC